MTLESHVFFRNQRKSNLQKEGMPEPYFGNWRGCSAVLININPGNTNPINNIDNIHDKDNLIKKYLMNESGKFLQYKNLAVEFPYLSDGVSAKNPARKWWEYRKRWVDRIIATYEDVEKIKERYDSEANVKPFAMELCPWHSKSWKRLTYNDDVYSEVEKNVLKPAQEIVRNSRLPFALCIGKPICDVLKDILGRMTGYYYKEFDFEDFGEQWPNNKKENPIDRTYAIIKTEDISFLCTWCSGSNLPPSKEFSDSGIEAEIIRKILESYVDN